MTDDIAYDSTTGSENSVTYDLSDGTDLNDGLTLTQSGQVEYDVLSSGSDSLWYNYYYNTDGELTGADIGSNSYTYSYGAASDSCGSGTNSDAGMNGNITSETINSSTTTYCYNYDDQLVSSSSSAADGDEYDSHGNLTQIGDSNALRLYYDSSDRIWGLVQYAVSTGNGNATYYDLDADGRVTYREYDAISGWDWETEGQYWYGYTGTSGGPSIVYNSSDQIIEENLTLPGGVTMTIRPLQSTQTNKYIYNMPEILGSTLLTTDGDGDNTSNGNGPHGAFTYDPYGNPLPGSNEPEDMDYGSFGYEGGGMKLTETTLTYDPILMGARVYLPTIGRFTSMDPMPGGNANAYAYSVNPIRDPDTSGMCVPGVACLSNEDSILQDAETAAQIQPTISAAQVMYTVDATIDVPEETSEERETTPEKKQNVLQASPSSSINSSNITSVNKANAMYYPPPQPPMESGMASWYTSPPGETGRIFNSLGMNNYCDIVFDSVALAGGEELLFAKLSVQLTIYAGVVDGAGATEGDLQVCH